MEPEYSSQLAEPSLHLPVQLSRPSLHLPVQLPGPSLGLPVQLSRPSLHLPVQLRNKILSYLPLWQLQLLDQQEQQANCLPDLPASAQAYSHLFSRANVAQILQLRFDLDANQLRRWYSWLFKPTGSLGPVDEEQPGTEAIITAPLLTPMQALTKLAMYFGQVGQDMLPSRHWNVENLALFLAQNQALEGAVEMHLFRQLLRHSISVPMVAIYQALRQPLSQSLQLLQVLADAGKITTDNLLPIIHQYYPSVEQMAVILPSLEQSLRDWISVSSEESDDFSRVELYWQSLMRQASNVGEIELGTPLARDFTSRLMLQLTSQQLDYITRNVVRLYLILINCLDLFSLMQLDFLLPSAWDHIRANLDRPGHFIDNCTIITRNKLACVPMLRQWLRAKLPTGDYLDAYLLSLDVIEGKHINYPLNRANFSILDDATFEYLTFRIDQYIVAVAGPNLSQTDDVELEICSDFWYQPKQLAQVQVKPDAIDLANCWRIGQQFNLCDYATYEEQHKANKELEPGQQVPIVNEPILILTLPSAQLDISGTNDIAGLVFNARTGIADKLTSMYQMAMLRQLVPFFRTVLGRNLSDQVTAPDIKSLDDLQHWVEDYPLIVIRWAQHQWQNRNSSTIGINPILAKLKVILSKIMISGSAQNEPEVRDYIANVVAFKLLRQG